MKATVFSYGILIGTTDLQVGDNSMGHIYGEFYPNEFYYLYLQKIIWKNKSDHGLWDALRLNIQLDNGCFLFSEGGINIEDSEEFQEECKRIDITGLGRHIIDDFLLEEYPRPFVVEPWESITIKEKIAYEAELNQEIGSKANNVSFNDKHMLAEFEVSAVCRNLNRADVLFEIHKVDFDKRFAVVQFTQKGFKNNGSYLNFELFENFDDFKYSRMYPDKVRWED